ncbi:MAG: type IV toxin-antitoxin system AbiEi family antitoxin domain-containing protein [Actinomycetota bacterium]|nr:type IV toxin-antitoxin system AbiEi family antitoxin domain-containing protein [Actinomycetota bacterium]
MNDTARRALADLATSQHHVITRRQADSLGFDKRRVRTALRAGWLREPTPGVLTIADARPTWQQSVMIVVLAAGGHGVASHRAAARLHHLDGFDFAGNTTVEVSVTRAFRLDPSVSSVAHHVTPLDPIDVTTIDGIPCTNLYRTLPDLGSVIRDPNQVRRALTSARRRGINLELLRTTTERLHRPGQAGTGVLLRLLHAIPWEGTLPATWFEELLALCLTDSSLPEIVPQYRITDASGRVVAKTDLGIPAVKLGLEAHSRRFHFGEDAEALDENRDIAASLCGWELTYLGWHATKRPDAVLKIVRELVAARRRELRSADL